MSKKGITRCGIFILAGLSIQQALAMTNNTFTPTSIFSSYVVTLSGGPSWANDVKSQTLYLTPDIEKTYHAKHPTNAVADGELFFGTQTNWCNEWQGQLGIALAATSNAKLSGSIWDDADPQFDNYTYQYKVNHKHIALKGKLLIDQGYSVLPWISGSLGIGFNQAHGFNNTPTIFEAVQMPNFSSHTQSSLTYAVGIGVQKPLSDHYQVGIGYEFADWGKSQLGHAAGQVLGTGLKINHLYTNGLLLNLTYFA